MAAASAEETTIPIYGLIQVNPSNTDKFVAITFMPVGAPTIVAGSVAIKKIS